LKILSLAGLRFGGHLWQDKFVVKVTLFDSGFLLCFKVIISLIEYHEVVKMVNFEREISRTRNEEKLIGFLNQRPVEYRLFFVGVVQSQLYVVVND
jgi:hypothetical protein